MNTESHRMRIASNVLKAQHLESEQGIQLIILLSVMNKL